MYLYKEYNLIPLILIIQSNMLFTILKQVRTYMYMFIHLYSNENDDSDETTKTAKDTNAARYRNIINHC